LEQSAAIAALFATPMGGRGAITGGDAGVPAEPEGVTDSVAGGTALPDGLAQQAKSVADSPKPAQPKVYTVRKGDSLSRIARQQGITVSALAKANGLKARSLIRIGTQLRIHSAGTEATREVPKENRGIASAAGVVDGPKLGDSALRYRGVPYRYAGMSSRGMDCSGLVARVLQAHGVRAPHNSRALYKLGTTVSRAKLKADDLVFFSTRGRGISHVGIYLGGGKFVHASSGGGRVQVDSLDSGYYAKRFAGARRLE
jgi:cell wall-associated NlpC family hydrolase